MQIEIRLEEGCTEPRIVVIAAHMSEELSELVRRVSEAAGAPLPPLLAGRRGERVELIDQADILRVYTASGKVFAATASGEYALRLRLYELEERLDRRAFVRISGSEIINLRKVRSFDLSLAGTICVSLADGSAAYVSRRYVPRIKELLGL